MHGWDLVHTDFNHTNILFDGDGTLTGVIDWDLSTARGDRHFGLVKLRYLLAWEAPDPVVLARLDELLEDLIEPRTLLTYWAHWGLRLVDWTISHFKPSDVEEHLRLAESRLLHRGEG
jgi:aminoglycoside phosphotransferase (APT) family kinase protein